MLLSSVITSKSDTIDNVCVLSMLLNIIWKAETIIVNYIIISNTKNYCIPFFEILNPSSKYLFKVFLVTTKEPIKNGSVTKLEIPNNDIATS